MLVERLLVLAYMYRRLLQLGITVTVTGRSGTSSVHPLRIPAGGRARRLLPSHAGYLTARDGQDMGAQRNENGNERDAERFEVHDGGNDGGILGDSNCYIQMLPLLRQVPPQQVSMPSPPSSPPPAPATARTAEGPQLYKVLEVSSDASAQDIKKAYRGLALKFHPDRGGSQTAFAEIEAAYRVLGDHDARRLYDCVGESGRSLVEKMLNAHMPSSSYAIAVFCAGFCRTCSTLRNSCTSHSRCLGSLAACFVIAIVWPGVKIAMPLASCQSNTSQSNMSQSSTYCPPAETDSQAFSSVAVPASAVGASLLCCYLCCRKCCVRGSRSHTYTSTVPQGQGLAMT